MKQPQLQLVEFISERSGNICLVFRRTVEGKVVHTQKSHDLVQPNSLSPRRSK